MYLLNYIKPFMYLYLLIYLYLVIIGLIIIVSYVSYEHIGHWKNIHGPNHSTVSRPTQDVVWVMDLLKKVWVPYLEVCRLPVVEETLGQQHSSS